MSKLRIDEFPEAEGKNANRRLDSKKSPHAFPSRDGVSLTQGGKVGQGDRLSCPTNTMQVTCVKFFLISIVKKKHEISLFRYLI